MKPSRGAALLPSFIAMLVIVTPALVFAQDIRQAVILGTARDPGIAALRQKVARESSNIEIIKSARRPQVSVSGDTGGDESASLGLNVTVSQLLTDWGLTKSRLNAAESERVKVVAQLKMEVENFTLDVAELYFDIHTAQRKLDRAMEYQKFAIRLADLSKERAEAGLANNSDVARAHLEISRAEDEVFQRKADVSIAKAELEFLIQQALADTPTPPRLNFAARFQSSSEVITAAVQAPDYLSAKADRDIARSEVDAARAARKPTIRLEATVREELSGGRGRSSAAGITAGVDLNSSSFRGTAIVAAEQNLRASEQTLQSVERKLQREVRFYVERLASLESLQQSLATQADQSQIVLDAYEEQFVAGQRDLNDLLLTGRDLFEAQTSVIDVSDQLLREEYAAFHSIGMLGPVLLESKRSQ
ncbi:TolC family protein [Roseovarius sp. MS2]|uniref:TolC family protein n=1 Tax=Roseovarius sp. MS2 TaxID=3390728 RepID=UPI003EDB8FD0